MLLPEDRTTRLAYAYHRSDWNQHAAVDPNVLAQWLQYESLRYGLFVWAECLRHALGQSPLNPGLNRNRAVGQHGLLARGYQLLDFYRFGEAEIQIVEVDAPIATNFTY